MKEQGIRLFVRSFGSFSPSIDRSVGRLYAHSLIHRLISSLILFVQSIVCPSLHSLIRSAGRSVSRSFTNSPLSKRVGTWGESGRAFNYGIVWGRTRVCLQLSALLLWPQVPLILKVGYSIVHLFLYVFLQSSLVYC